MKEHATCRLLALVTLLGTSLDGAFAAVHYVDLNSPSPSPPYTNWATAATVIQDAVDVAAGGDEVVVTNGIYANGGRALTGTMTNRVAVDKPLTVRSVNGPEFTLLQGRQVPGNMIGDGAIRCAYLTNGASLSGFTLTRGATRDRFANPDDQNGGGVWCASAGAVVSNCVISGNYASSSGGGAQQGTLKNCMLTGNWADFGGGASDSTLDHCTLTQNAAGRGGAVFASTLRACTLSGNFAEYGGGAAGDTLNNCTLTGNSATSIGGGAYGSVLNNCIVYFNTANYEANYDSDSTLNYCCTTPLPSGLANITLDPQLVSGSRLRATSPCRGAGSPAFATGTDIDGEVWANPPSIGCDEYHGEGLSGPLSASVAATVTNVAIHYPVGFTAFINGSTAVSVWDFGDGMWATNEPYASHAWSTPGDYPVVLYAYNNSNPGGVSTTLTIHVEEGLHYVAAASLNPAAPYTSWATAATNIQDAVDASAVGGTILVTNGTYAFGGGGEFRGFNSVAVDRPLTLRSVNGPQVTVINGARLYSCVYLTNGASLSGFTLTNGFPPGSGGGVWCESAAVVSNCVIVNNSAYYGGGAYSGTLFDCTLTGNLAIAYGGGGAYKATLNNCALTGNSASDYAGGGAEFCTLNNCTLTGNSAACEGGGAGSSTLNNCIIIRNNAPDGGGAFDSALNNCTLTGNAAQSGGGAYKGTLNNCIVYFNTATNGANFDPSATLNYCCTTPLPPGGAGNISPDPELADAWHLSTGSPCRGAGSANYTSGTDIDGEPWSSPPAIGCDEYLAGAVTGSLSVNIGVAFTTVTPGYVLELTPLIQGRATMSVWDFGDGTGVTNQPFVSHSWSALGDYVVVLRAYNDSLPGGISATVTLHIIAPPVYFVAGGNINPVAPYTSWATAATNIQDAVDAATTGVPGSWVLVTNGTFTTGGRSQDGITTNRTVVSRFLTLLSVNGPQFTSIDGGGAVRCVYLANGARLSGFTLTNGAAYDGGGLWCESATSVASNCLIVGNFVYVKGGGAYEGTLYNCSLSGNSAEEGGGAFGCTLNNCTLTGNSAENFYGDSAGGGASQATLNNCALTGNSATYGGGAEVSILNNCTLVGNSALSYNGVGGGAAGGTLNNCIVYFNTATNGANFDPFWTLLNYCCTTPLPATGIANISNNPQLADAWHLSADSPCRGAGSSVYATGTDIDGEAWANQPSIGCDEYYAAGRIGPLNVSVAATRTNTPIGFPVGLAALIQGPATLSVWDFGDGLVATNQPFTSHVWTSQGTYAVVLTAYNQGYPAGVSATVTIHVDERIKVTTAPTTNWTAVASSADGTKLVALNVGDYTSGEIYTSTDSGTNWTPATAPPVPWHSIASSADGTKLAALGNGAIYSSSNSGATWTLTSAPHADLLFQPGYSGVASSADGAKLVAVAEDISSNGVYNFFGPIYKSTNFGATWTKTSAPNKSWLAVASSADGTRLAAVAGGTAGGPIYTSTNSGASWAAANAPTARWLCVASSADGSKLAAGASGDQPGGGIYTSTDGGQNWTLTSAPSDVGWTAIASSADGTRLIAASEGLSYYGGDAGPIYVSPDSGVTWTLTEAPIQSWSSVACSADGSKIVASVWDGPIFTLQFPLPPSPLAPSPHLSIHPSAGNLSISWLVPSTSFWLQQNPDLTTTDWTDVPTIPTLNFTNLHYEVTVLRSMAPAFYRLKQR